MNVCCELFVVSSTNLFLVLIFKMIEIFNVHDVVITYAVHAIAANKYPIG